MKSRKNDCLHQLGRLTNGTKCSHEIFLKNDRKKVNFRSILSEELRREGHDVRNGTGHADTQIVSAALQYAVNIDNYIAVVAGGTDILALLMFHWKEGMNIYMLAETPNKKMWIASFGR